MQTQYIQHNPKDRYICVYPVLLVEYEDKGSYVYIEDVSLDSFVVNILF
jgi:hypothetical protein